MSFQFAIYYLFNKTLQVESTSLIVGNLDQFNQVTLQPDLDSDDDWLEIKWPTRKEPEKTVAAKVLLFGDSFKDLVTKNNLFILGKDIWTKEESMGEKKRKKKMLETNVVEAKKARLVKQRKTLKAARPKPSTLDHHTNSEDATNIGSPPCSDHHSSPEDATMIWSQHQPDVHPLAGSEVRVSKRAFQRLNRSRMTIFAQELAVLVFTKDVLAQSTLTGKSGKGGPP
ncbi:hypothetical protein E1301_Tti011795 [Triplophysa tibetana]|uniref:Uncharacterized protein n=1 Tax=Triplophysa tibetana TaxID=1572043 RepID=A0A5A9NGQ6_9TELE|nr:hypothetical protein E1301_Tti011795 [Triplophysa tibetana]